jgi:hypothetical protein
MKSLLAALAAAGVLAIAVSAGHAQSAAHDPPKFTSMSRLMSSDADKIGNDLGLLTRDARAGQTGAEPQPCYNLKNNVDPDAAAIGYFVQNDVTNDVTNLQSDINTLEADIRNFNQDLADFANDGVPAPSGATATLASIKGKIAAAVRRANASISQMQGQVDAAYARGNKLAIGACASDGPGDPPAIPSVTY